MERRRTILSNVAVLGVMVFVGVVSAASARQMTGASPGQMPVYDARVEVIRVHAAVLDDDGNPVTGLTAEDFVVIDNGVEHEVALALTPADSAIDVALVFDQSESIRQGAPTVKRDARAFLDALGSEDCALILPFQHRIGPGLWGPSLDPSLLQTIDQFRLEGGTSFNDALMVGISEVQQWNVPLVIADRVVTEYQQPRIAGGVGIQTGPPPPEAAPPEAPPSPATIGFDRDDLPFRVFRSNLGCGRSGIGRPDRRKALVVLSDGVDTTSAHTFGELLSFLATADVPVFPVGIGLPGRGDSVRRENRAAVRLATERLEKLAHSSGGKFFLASGSETDLRAAYDEIVTILRGSYLLGYYPSDAAAAAPATHEIEVRLRRGGHAVRARSGFLRMSGDAATARVMMRHGVEAILDGRLDDALVAARQTVGAEPGFWGGYLLESTALWFQGDGPAAATALQRALWLKPGIVAAHQLAWQLAYDAGEDEAAWRHAILAHIAGGDMEAEMDQLAERFAEPPALEARLQVPRVFVEGPRGDDAAIHVRLADVVGALSRGVSGSSVLGLVRDPWGADYFLYIDAEGIDNRRPRFLQSRLELYSYVDQRLWRGDMDVDDLDDPSAISEAVDGALRELERWLTKER